VEWPEKAGDLIPQADMDIILQPGDDGRMLQIRANSSLAEQCLQGMKAE